MNQGKPVVRRSRTQNNSTTLLMLWLEQYTPFERLGIVQAGIQEEAEAMRESVHAYWPKSIVPVFRITPVFGAHLGFGALGLVNISKE